MTDPLPSPSTVLADLAHAVYRLEATVDARPLEAWLALCEAEFEALRDLKPWEWPVDQLWSRPELHGVSEPRDKILVTFDEFRRAAVAIVLLDLWHMPITALGYQGTTLRDSHRRAQERFAMSLRFDEDSRHGRLVPARVLADPAIRNQADRILLNRILEREPIDDTGRHAVRVTLLRRLLRHTTFLPHHLARMDAGDATKSRGDLISLRYNRATGMGFSDLFGADPLKVMVAPMAERIDDVELQLSAAGDAYGMRPCYPRARIAAIIEAAIGGGAHLLCLPEMTLTEEHLPDCLEELRRRRLEFLEVNGRLPPLAYIFMGVYAPPDAETGRGRNYLLLLDADGNELVRQDKLYRWDLNANVQERLGLRPPVAVSVDVLEENIVPGAQITLLDLDDLGRLATLICADVSANMPGDWLLGHVSLDWLHAPIMDHSTCWERDAAGPLGPWIVRRAIRAALLSEARVIVTNSMPLTHRVNASNARRGLSQRYPPFEECGIALLIDASQPEPAYEHILVPLDAPSPVAEIRTWNEDWLDLRSILTRAEDD